METEYDIFEVLLNRSVKWHLCARGKKAAIYMLKLVASRTLNECFAIDLETQVTIERLNCGSFAVQSSTGGYQPTAH